MGSKAHTKEQLREEIARRKESEETLRESEERYRQLIETANDAIFIADAETGIILNANKKAGELLGIPPEQIIGMHQKEMHAKEDEAYYRKMFLDNAQRDGGVILDNVFVWHRNGYRIPIEVSSSAVKMGGKIVMQGIFRDITERKKMEEEIREAKEYLENIIESSVDGIVVSDAKGYITNANKSYQELMGYRKEEVIGESTGKFGPAEGGTYESTTGEMLRIDKEFINVSKKMISKLRAEGKVSNWEGYCLRKDEKIVPIEMNIVLLHDKKGDIIGSVGINRDITRRRIINERLKQSEEKYYKLIEHANDAIISLNGEGAIIGCNKSAEEMFGYSREEMLGKPTFFLVTQEARERQKKAMGKLIETGTRQHIDENLVEGTGVKKDGKEFNIEFSYYIISIEGESIVTAIIRDISERKIAEKKLLDYQNQLKSLTSQLTLTEEQGRRRFAEFLHDEIGQHLFATQLQLELLKGSLSSAKNTKTLDNAINYIKRVIDQSRSLTFELSSPILYELGLEKALEWLAEQAHKKYDIMVTFTDDKREKPLDDDVKIFIYQTVRELLINVAKHAKTKNASVSVKKDNSNIRICVEDNGVGFHSQNRQSSDSKIQGFGLFSITERLEQLGGQLEIESQPNRGTHITLIVPLSNGT